MPRIAQYGPSRVSTQVTQGARARNAPAGAFQTPLASGLSEAATAANTIATRMDTTSAEEAAVNFEREKNELFFNADSGYFNTQGKNAHNQAAVTNSALGDLKAKYEKDLSTRSRRMFGKVADTHIARAQTDIMRHSAKGLQAWEVATINSQVENTIENASLYWNDPDRMKVQNALGRQAVIDGAQLKGITGEALNELLQDYDSAFAGNSIDAATASSATEGQAMLDQVGNRLEGPLKIKAEKAVAAKAKAEKTQSDARSAITTATNLVGTYDTREEINEQVNKIEDPELRKKTASEARLQFNAKKTADTELRTASYEQAEGFIADGGTAEAFKAGNAEAWERLSPKQQRAVESGKLVSTDWSKYSGLMTLPKDQLAQVDPTEHFTDLAPAERSKLIAAVKSANNATSGSEKADAQVGRSRTAQTASAAQQLYGKPAVRDEEKFNAFHALVDDEVTFREEQKGGKLTSQEYTDLLGDLTREAVTDAGIFFDTTGTIKTLDDGRLLQEMLQSTGQPVNSQTLFDIRESMQEVIEFLEENGIATTPENIVIGYQQAR